MVIRGINAFLLNCEKKRLLQTTRAHTFKRKTVIRYERAKGFYISPVGANNIFSKWLGDLTYSALRLLPTINRPEGSVTVNIQRRSWFYSAHNLPHFY